MPARDRPRLTSLHWLVLGLVTVREIGIPERLASEMHLDLEEIETVCNDLATLGWIERVVIN
jgi:hypothetical protein